MVLSVLWFAANNSTAQYTPQNSTQRDFELPCGPSMTDCPKTSGNRPRRFPAGFLQVSGKQTKSLVISAFFELYIYSQIYQRDGTTSDFVYLLETCWKPPLFPYNPSLTDHTVHFIHEYSTFQLFWVVGAVRQKFFNIGVEYAKYILFLYFFTFSRGKKNFLGASFFTPQCPHKEVG